MPKPHPIKGHQVRFVDYDEPLLRPCERLSIFPIEHTDIWDMYKKAQGCTWTAEEIKLSEDLADWEKLDHDTKEMIKSVLGFFSGADMIVNENLASNMMEMISIPEARCFYGFQIMMENVHAETYSLMIENLIRDKQERLDLFNAVQTIPEVHQLYSWAQKWIYSGNFADKVVAFACFEGIVFSGMFAVIFWIKEMGVLPALTFSNELISRDEGLHRDFACLMYKKLEKKLSTERLHTIVQESTELTKQLMRRTTSGRLKGLNIDDLCTYIEYVADHLLTNLVVDKLYKVKNPLIFMDKISFSGFSNFFERNVGEYGVSGFEEGKGEININDCY